MNYKRILRMGSTVVEAVEPTFEEEDSYLTEEEVSYMMTKMKRLQDLYFPDVPMSDSLKHAKKFLYNIPRNVFRLIKKIDDEDGEEILSPLFMIYPLLAAGLGVYTQKIYLERLSYSILSTDEEVEEEVDEDE